MKNPYYQILSACVLVFLFGLAGAAVAEQDSVDCKDHPMFTRMPNFFIRACGGSDFDRHEFSSEEGPIAVEGKKTALNYFLKEGSPGPSTEAIVRNYMNAVKKIGGTVVYDGGTRATFKVTRQKQEIWVGVNAAVAYEYTLDIVVKGEMQQDVVATAEVMASDIFGTGHAALYGLSFDTGKAEVKAESESSLKEIAKLLKQNPAMKLFVVGHTDNAGSIGANLTLSKARAESVVKALTDRHGAGAGRLAAYGVGSLSPVAPGTTEEGRARNRRVELVVQ